MGQILTLTQHSCQGQPLARAETIKVETANVEADLEAEMKAFEAVAARTEATLLAYDRASMVARSMELVAMLFSVLILGWLAFRIGTGI